MDLLGLVERRPFYTILLQFSNDREKKKYRREREREKNTLTKKTRHVHLLQREYETVNSFVKNCETHTFETNYELLL